MKIGVYLPTNNSPLFLRFALLQILTQSLTPHVVAIHENWHEKSYLWVVRDLIEHHRSVKILHTHTPFKIPQPAWQSVPLQMLYDYGCTEFFKADQDDIWYTDHIKQGMANLRDYAYATSVMSHCMALFPKTEYMSFIGNFGGINPTGGQASSCRFNREFAGEYLSDMRQNIGMADDVVLSNITTPKFSVYREPNLITTGFIMHAANATTPYKYADGVKEAMKGVEIA